MVAHTNDPRLDIGPFRKLRLKANAQGYWEVWWTDARGKAYLTKHESCRTKVRAEAEAYFDEFCRNAREAEALLAAGSAAVPTVDELCRRWLDYMAPVGKDRTARQVLTPVRRLLGHAIADQLDSATLQDYARQRPVKPGTIRRELGALRTVLFWGAKQKLISRDDVPEFDEAVLPPEGPPRDRFLSPAQARWFWDQAIQWGDPAFPGEPDSAYRVMLFACLGLDTAARREAILELTWDRVDLSLKMIDYRVPGRRLTKKRRVRVPISDRLLPVLKEAWLRAPKDAAGHAVGRVVGTQDIHKPFARFTASIGVPWVTPHVLRHTWGSLKAMKGESLYDIALFMGDTVATIERYYLHLTPDHLRKVVNA